MFTIPSKLLCRRTFQKYGKCFFSEKSNKNTFKNKIFNQSKHLKYLAASGALAILTSMYINKYKKRNKNMMLLGNDMELAILKEKEEPSIRNQFNFIDKVVKKCASAVFYLEIRDPMKKDPETGEPAVTSNGSGFIISEDGWAITNAHVVLNKPQSTISAIFRDGRSFPVQVEDADLNIDLALLKLKTDEKLPQLQFARSGDTSVGEWVVALGSPLNMFVKSCSCVVRFACGVCVSITACAYVVESLAGLCCVLLSLDNLGNLSQPL
ncbi:unnamed protein product [Brassicogethes aeneus]|uniref:Uncharacterized protein n=1 Tax=Brassicogethes aeneus TaxID=1431903 RepID=A0A9P0ASG0_BRAAE|nr:unnamed protein product [Brassicogethes aeneus]